MIVTRAMLVELGLQNVVILPPVALVNSQAVVAVVNRYPTIEEMKSTQWFEDGIAGGLTLICEGSTIDNGEEGYLVRLHKIGA
jgi:hypothetical protein